MSGGVVDLYVNTQSVYHSMNPRTKVFWWLLLMWLAVFFTDLYVVSITTAVLMISFLFLCGLPVSRIKYVAKLVTPPMVAIFVPFPIVESLKQTGHALLYIDWPSYHSFAITDAGFYMGGIVVMRAIIAAVSTLIVFMTTNKEGMMYAFDSFGLGYKIGTMISITLTFIPSVLSTLETIMDAQRSRGFAWDKGGIVKRARGIPRLALPMVSHAISQMLILPLAMESRGFDAHPKRSYFDDYQTKAYDYFVIALCGAVFALTLVAGYWLRLIQTTL